MSYFKKITTVIVLILTCGLILGGWHATRVRGNNLYASSQINGLRHGLGVSPGQEKPNPKPTPAPEGVELQDDEVVRVDTDLTKSSLRRWTRIDDLSKPSRRKTSESQRWSAAGNLYFSNSSGFAAHPGDSDRYKRVAGATLPDGKAAARAFIDAIIRQGRTKRRSSLLPVNRRSSKA